jgi:hypothetical protein
VLNQQVALMTIEILGEGCSKCGEIKKNVQQAIKELGLNIVVDFEMNPERIARLKVLFLPQLVVNGNIVPSSVWKSALKLKELFRQLSSNSV